MFGREGGAGGTEGVNNLPDPAGAKAGGGPPGEKTEVDGTPTPVPFTLSEGLPPVPAKLVQKIQRGDFVDMAELLRDNMELERRQPATEGQRNAIWPAGKANRREVPDILSWITCFGMYASVVCDKTPGRVRELLTYQTVLVREARRCGGKGWLAYDTMFRQQAANNVKVDWSVLNTSLYANTFLAQQNTRGKTCQWCLETDHAATSCALAPATQLWQPGRPSRVPQREWNQEERRPGRGKPEVRGACFAWNDGRCTLPYCQFKHVCSKCGSTEHKESLCSQAHPGQPREGAGASRVDHAQV